MYSKLHEIFDKLDALVAEKKYKFYPISRFTSAFYGAPEVVESELIPELVRLSTEPRFRTDVHGLYIDDVKEKLRSFEADLKENPEDRAAILAYQYMYEEYSPRLAIKDFDGLLDYLQTEVVRYPGCLEPYEGTYRSSHGEGGTEFVERTISWYRVGHMLHTQHWLATSRVDFFEQSAAKQVAQEYAEIGVDLTKDDPQFLKYKILSLNPNHEIHNDKDSQAIFEARTQKYYRLNVPFRLLSALEALRQQGYYSDIAFNIKAVTDYVLMLDEMERGSKLKINVAEMPEVSAFFSTDAYDDKLWVVHDKQMGSLTFEELREDFQVLGEKVVTQVVHLMYKVKDGTTLITHLDHEYIVYTLEQYMAKVDDHSVKGSAGKIKSFKIDDAEIPFDFKYKGDWFLLIVLDAYFLNHQLVQEVFEELGS